VTWSGSSGAAPLAAAGQVYGYLYDSGGGVAALSVSTTAPAFSTAEHYWHETGDTGRRLVWAGWVWSATAGYRIVPFWAQCAGGLLRVGYESDVSGADSWRFSLDQLVVSGGTASNPVAFSLTVVPPVAVAWTVSGKLLANSAGADGILGIGPMTWDSSLPPGAAAASFTVRAVNPTSGSRTFFGRYDLPIVSPQTAYYALQIITGSASANIEVTGFAIPLE
jgi:hypothetical protein